MPFTNNLATIILKKFKIKKLISFKMLQKFDKMTMNSQLPPPGPPGGGFRSFVGEMKRDFPTLNEFTK